MSRRLGLWITVLALPLAALGLLVGEPSLDRRWEHHPSHFWLCSPWLA
jgi:adenylate cyclase